MPGAAALGHRPSRRHADEPLARFARKAVSTSQSYPAVERFVRFERLPFMDSSSAQGQAPDGGGTSSDAWPTSLRGTRRGEKTRGAPSSELEAQRRHDHHKARVLDSSGPWSPKPARIDANRLRATATPSQKPHGYAVSGASTRPARLPENRGVASSIMALALPANRHLLRWLRRVRWGPETSTWHPRASRVCSIWSSAETRGRPFSSRITCA